MPDFWTQYDDYSIVVLNRLTQSGKMRGECLQLLEAARDSGRFLPHIRGLIQEGGGKIIKGKKLPEFAQIDENEFKNLPWTIQGESLWENMKKLPPVDACRPGLWLYATLSAIESNAMQSHYLAAGMNGNNDTGLARLDETLKYPDNPAKRDAPLYLETTRLILRRAYGAISARGQKGVFTDVPYAKIWWQRYLAEDMEKTTGITADEMINFFSGKGTKSVYEELTRFMSSRLTVIGDKPVRDGLMGFFYHANKNSGSAPGGFDANGTYFKKLARRLGIMLGWRAMGIMTFEENKRIMAECAADIGIAENDENAEASS